MANEIANVQENDAALAAIAATKNDLSQMTEEQRAQLYGAVCRSIGLNPLTSPFEYIKLNGKLTLYAKKGATDQIRDLRNISITSIVEKELNGVLMVTVTAQDGKGRTDSDVGAVVTKGLQGEALANAYMKAITKAKRRVTLSLAGLGFLDESETDTIPASRAQLVNVDHQTGEIIDAPQALEEPKYTPEEHREIALTHFDKLIGQVGASKEEVEAFIRKGGEETGTMDNMSVDQIRQAYRFIKNMGDNAKKYFETTLAEQQELEAIQVEGI